MSEVFDRNACALLNHDLVGRDRRRRLGRLHVRSVRLDVRDNCPERDSPDNSGYCGRLMILRISSPSHRDELDDSLWHIAHSPQCEVFHTG